MGGRRPPNVGPKNNNNNKNLGKNFAPNWSADNIASDFQCSWNFGAKNIAAQFLQAIFSVLRISPGGFLIASQGYIVGRTDSGLDGWSD